MQARAIGVAVYQDDITVLAIGWDIARTVEERLPNLLTGAYGIQLGNKPEANIPFHTTFSALGATFHMKNMKHIRCKTRPGLE